MRDRMVMSACVVGLVMIPVAMGVGWHVDKVDLSETLAAERAAMSVLNDKVEQQEKTIGEYDKLLAVACDGLWACDWRWKMQDKVVSDKDVDAWLRALRYQDVGMVACRKAYPKGAEYAGGVK